MVALAAVFDQLAAGAVVVLPDDCYQGVAGLTAAGTEKQRWSVQRLPVDDMACQVIERDIERTAATLADPLWTGYPANLLPEDKIAID
jgi:cystathionine gamma-synthase